MNYFNFNIDKALEDIRQAYERKDLTLNMYKLRVQELTDENWKDDEVQALNTQLNELKSVMAHSFIITEEEYEKINEWRKAHAAKYHPGTTTFGAIGGNYTYEFIPTSLGECGSIICSACKTKNLKDSEFTFRNIG